METWRLLGLPVIYPYGINPWKLYLRLHAQTLLRREGLEEQLAAKSGKENTGRKPGRDVGGIALGTGLTRILSLFASTLSSNDGLGRETRCESRHSHLGFPSARIEGTDAYRRRRTLPQHARCRRRLRTASHGGWQSSADPGDRLHPI